MHKTVREALYLVEELDKSVGQILDKDIVVCPPFTSLYPVGKFLEKKRIKLGAQDLHWEEKGAYTGEVSAEMLKDAGCQYVIIGHSERRGYFGETDETVNLKVKTAVNYGLLPIICVGETLEQRERGLTRNIVIDQTRKALKDITPTQGVNIAIAYEPIWAIGTGKTDTPAEANETIGIIRSTLTDLFTYEVSQKIRILYGGSVKPENIDGFMKESEIDGALVGGASLNPESFTRIVNFQQSLEAKFGA